MSGLVRDAGLFTIFKMTGTGKAKYEAMAIRRPYSSVLGALYDSNDAGATIPEIKNRVRMTEGMIRGILSVLARNGYVKIEASPSSSQPSNIKSLPL